MRSTIFAILSVVWAAQAVAKPITEADIRSAKKIVIFMGSFDPVTLGHLSAAEAVLRESDTDLVVILPTPDPFIKVPLPIQTRLQLLEAAAHSQSQIVYPAEGYKDSLDWINKIKEWNPGAVYSGLIGDDKAADWERIRYLNKRIKADKWFISVRSGSIPEKFTSALPKDKIVLLKTALSGISSTKVRNILYKTPELYFEPNSPQAVTASENLDQYLVPAEKDLILKRGVYLSTNPQTHRSYVNAVLSTFSKSVHRTLRASGIFDFYKTFIVHTGQAHAPTTFQMGDRVFPVEALLGQGMHSSAYKVTIDGKPYALKIPKNNPADKAELLRAAITHRWVETHTKINIPQLLQYDPQGEWSLSEYIEGEIPTNTDLEESSPSHSSLKAMVEESQKLSELSQINLDLALDNIRIRDNRAYLLDLGALPADSAYVGGFGKTLENWKSQARGRSWRESLNCFVRKIQGGLNE